jgi:hypothetical protein
MWWAAVAFGIAASWASPASADDEGNRGPRRGNSDQNDASPYRGPQNVVNPNDDNDSRHGVRNRSTEDRAGERGSARANRTARGERLRSRLCRIWTPGTPRTQQSALGNCDVLRTQLPAGARLIRGR